MVFPLRIQCCIIKSTFTHIEYVLFNAFYSREVLERYLVLRWSMSAVFCAIRNLFVGGGTLCLMLVNFNMLLKFVIMWCVEEYCDMHQ